MLPSDQSLREIGLGPVVFLPAPSIGENKQVPVFA